MDDKEIENGLLLFTKEMEKIVRTFTRVKKIKNIFRKK